MLQECLEQTSLRFVHALQRKPTVSQEPRLRIVQGALPRFPQELFPKDKPFVIVHFASVQRSSDPKELSVNQEGIRQLIQAAGDNCRGIIFGSSMSVHGQGEQVFVDGQSPCRPETPLAESRYLCEEIIRDACGKRGLNYAILRPRFILDVNDPSTLAPWIKMAKAGILPGSGKQRFSVIERRDYAKIVMKLAEECLSRPLQRIFPVGYAEPLVFGELWRSIRGSLGQTSEPRLRIPANPAVLRGMRRCHILPSLAVKLELMGCDHFADVKALKPYVSSSLLSRDPLAVTRSLVEKSLASAIERTVA